MHLGMSGSFRVGKNSTPGTYYHERSKSTAHDHIVFHMSNGTTVTFNDPRRFGSMKLVPRARFDEEPLLRALGPEPLGNEFDAAMLAKACAGKKTSLKAALSDQRVVAGLGNIYVCEALFRARLSPKRCLDDRRPERQAERAGGKAGRSHQGGADGCDRGRWVLAAGSSARRWLPGRLQHNFRVYDREGEPCPPARGRSNVLCRSVARPSIARVARNSSFGCHVPDCRAEAGNDRV